MYLGALDNALGFGSKTLPNTYLTKKLGKMYD